MTPTETTAILRQFNEWRRGDEDIPQFDPREIGEAIDAAIAMIDRLEAAESDALEQARLNGVGSEREAALMVKLEAAEKDIALKERIIDSLGSTLNAVANERDQLSAEIAIRSIYGNWAAPSVPTIEAAEAMGAKGGPVVEAERLAFEAWMRGHCWRIGGHWNGTEYLGSKEHSGWLDPHAMQTRQVWASWRDRAALAAEAKP